MPVHSTTAISVEMQNARSVQLMTLAHVQLVNVIRLIRIKRLTTVPAKPLRVESIKA
jgi:hypothetical protein